MRLIVHSGFHKTGTSSVQKALRRNRDTLSPHLRIFTVKEIASVSYAARAYSVNRSPGPLQTFQEELNSFLATLDPSDLRPVMISSEDLCGRMPGRRDITSYSQAAPTLMRTFKDACQNTFANDLSLTLFLTLREQESWLKSLYAQNLSYSRLTLTWPEFRDTYAPLVNLEASVADIRKAVPGTEVLIASLETIKDTRLGPVTPLLEIAAVPADVQATLKRSKIANKSLPEELLQLFREANGSDMPDDALEEAKKMARKIWLRDLDRLLPE